jgi:hypothetical protein
MKSKDKKRVHFEIEQRKLDKELGKYFNLEDLEKARRYRENPEQYSEEEKQEIEEQIRKRAQLHIFLQQHLEEFEKYEYMERMEEEEIQRKRKIYENAMKRAEEKKAKEELNKNEKTE